MGEICFQEHFNGMGREGTGRETGFYAFHLNGTGNGKGFRAGTRSVRGLNALVTTKSNVKTANKWMKKLNETHKLYIN